MYVCLCHGVKDKDIEGLIRQGHTSVRAIRECSGAGGDCGSCACDVRAMLQRVRARDQREIDLVVAAK